MLLKCTVISCLNAEERTSWINVEKIVCVTEEPEFLQGRVYDEPFRFRRAAFITLEGLSGHIVVADDNHELVRSIDGWLRYRGEFDCI